MILKQKSLTVLAIISLVSVLLLTPFFVMKSSAASLGEAFLFLERMEVDTETDMVVLVTPSTDFDGVDERVLNIFFPAGSGDWCRVNNTNLSVLGVTTGAVNMDIGTWEIDAALPGVLAGKCLQSAGGDYIQITGIGSLSANTSYGLNIDSHAQFKLKNEAGGHIVSFQLVEGTKVETISFRIAVLDSDQVTVTAEVVDVHTITCTLPTPTTVDLEEMYAGGAYITATHTLSTNSTSPYYWAVYGKGDDSAAGLYKGLGDLPAYLIPSIGTGGVVNLITGTEGFGLAISALADGAASAATNYGYTTPGVFGSILYGFSNARLIFSNTTASSGGSKDATVILGARASTNAHAGDYEETLTYICGAFIGDL